MAARKIMDDWRKILQEWYPDLERQAYFVPPVVISRIPFDSTPFAGLSVLVPNVSGTSNPISQKPATSNLQSPVPAISPTASRLWTEPDTQPIKVQESDTRDDIAQQKVLSCFHELALKKKEVMFVISQLNFSDYLGMSNYSQEAQHFLRPGQLNLKANRQGDFDILIIHRHYGILICEIKSIDPNQCHDLNLSQCDIDKKISDRLNKAIVQLNKSENVVRELSKDLEPNLKIRKTLIFPYLQSNDLHRLIKSDQKIKQELLRCLAASDRMEAVEFCLLQKHFILNKGRPPLKQLLHWWAHRFADKRDGHMTWDLYLDLLARFCGPATSISMYCVTPPRLEVRTSGDAVSAVGERMALLVLTPEQLSLLTRAPPRIMINGPPGVGKSVMLGLMAIHWLQLGFDVQLVAINTASLPISLLLQKTIQMSVKPPSGTLTLREYDMWNSLFEGDRAVSELTSSMGTQGLHVICDEFWIDDNHRDWLHHFVGQLCSLVPDVGLWTAAVRNVWIPPELKSETLTINLRNPPAVLEKVRQGVSSMFKGVVSNYSMTSTTSSSDGPSVIILRHQGPLHRKRWPTDCYECGHSIGNILRKLGVGVARSGSKARSPAQSNKSSVNQPKGKETTTCSPLQYRDVFVLTMKTDLNDEIAKNDTKKTEKESPGVVRGLRENDIPVRVLRCNFQLYARDVLDTALAQSDVVTLTEGDAVPGLERKIVVWLLHRRPDVDEMINEHVNKNDDYAKAINMAEAKVFALSRCTSQLILVDVPFS